MAATLFFVGFLGVLVGSTPTYAAPQAAPRAASSSICRSLPGDASWPSAQVWDAFNASVGGRLIANTPIAALCHYDSYTTYDAAGCAALQETWYLPQTHYVSSSSMMSALFTNDSCNPFLNASAPCTMGNYPVYSVNASSAADYQATLKFSQEHNIRLVIRNTGADYNGKSSGAGSLALWTHFLKGMEMLQYNSNYYTGPAFKFGAGVQTFEALDFASANGHLVVGPNVPEVGIVGGYSQGAGHGPLASQFGLGADQVLEWEAVLANGAVVTATPNSEYADLYWALCGGGPGTYAAVLSATVKAHPALPVSTGNMTFAATANTSEVFWDAVQFVLEYVPSINDAGASSVFYVYDDIFDLASLFGPGFTQTELDDLMQPVLTKLESLGIAYTYASQTYPTFAEGFFAQPEVNISILNIGGRLIPRTLVESNSTALTAAIRNITSYPSSIFSGVTFNVSSHGADSVGANPYWRESIFDAVFGIYVDWTDWAANWQSQDLITDTLLPQLEDLTPNGAAYLNEYDFQQPDWQTTLYGTHWNELSLIKAKYDPTGVFYALEAVGSERWTEQIDGRLCLTM